MGEQPTYVAMSGVVGEPGFGGVVAGGNFHSEAPAGMQAVPVGGQGRQQMQQPAPHMQQQQVRVVPETRHTINVHFSVE